MKLLMQLPNNILQEGFLGNSGKKLIFRSIFLVFESLWTKLFFDVNMYEFRGMPTILTFHSQASSNNFVCSLGTLFPLSLYLEIPLYLKKRIRLVTTRVLLQLHQKVSHNCIKRLILWAGVFDKAGVQFRQ